MVSDGPASLNDDLGNFLPVPPVILFTSIPFKYSKYSLTHPAISPIVPCTTCTSHLLIPQPFFLHVTFQLKQTRKTWMILFTHPDRLTPSRHPIPIKAISHIPPLKPTRLLPSGLPIGPKTMLSPICKLALFRSVLTILRQSSPSLLTTSSAIPTFIAHTQSSPSPTKGSDGDEVKVAREVYREWKLGAKEYRWKKDVLRGREDGKSVFPEWKGTQGKDEWFDEDGISL